VQIFALAGMLHEPVSVAKIHLFGNRKHRLFNNTGFNFP
jgi:hypothetical protein